MPEKQPDISVIISAAERLDHEVDIHSLSNQLSLDGVGTSLTTDQKFFILKRLNYESLMNLDDLPETAAYMIEKVEGLHIEEALIILKQALIDHDFDVNIQTADYQLWEILVNLEGSEMSVKKGLSDAFEKSPNSETITEIPPSFADRNSSDAESGSYSYEVHQIIDWNLQVRLEAALIEFYSPYPEVRAVTDPYDDPYIPCETVRVYILGLIWCSIGAVIDQFFSERQPSINLYSSVVQIFLLPCGTLLHWILPAWKFKIWKLSIDLNPGPWSHKEQMLATLFYTVSGVYTSYFSYNIHAQKLPQFYNNQWADFGYQTLMTLSTNFMGFGFAGIVRKFAIYPVQSVWPTVLPSLAVNRALMQPEKREIINGWKISRFNFFFVAAVCSWVYYWVTNYLFQALSTFNWMTWIKPDNLDLVNITGTFSGLGLNPIPSFDWNFITALTSPLTVPFFNIANGYLGGVLSFFIITGVWYSNYKWSRYIPINSNLLFTNTGEPYSVSEVIDSKSLFDQEKYDSYGPPFYSASNIVVYGANFALYPFAFFYEVILHNKVIMHAFRQIYGMLRNFKQSSYEGFHDPYSRQMKKYKEVPEWAFACILVMSIVFAILAFEIYPTETPVWTIFFVIALNFVFLIPITAIYSRTGFSFYLNVVTELIIGYALPGNGVALMSVKTLGVNLDSQSENYITNQKQAHYLKIPPRALFRIQILSVIVASFIQLGIINFQIDGGVQDYCSPTNRQKFTCPNATIFYSASIAWGVIGPKKVFNGLYPVLPYCFLIGFLLVFPCIAFKWYGPKKITKYFQPSIIIGGFLNWAPYNLTYYTGGLYLSSFFMYYLKKNYLSWWSKYTYILGAGLSAGVAFSAIIVFFAVEYHDKPINWWGNTVMYGGYEGYPSGGLNATLSAPDGYFGPRIGHFP